MGSEAGLEGVIGGITDESGVVGVYGKKGGEAVDQCGAEALVDAGLVGQVTIEVFGGIERVVGFGDVGGEDGGVDLNFVPVVQFERFGELLAINANLPGQQAGGCEF